MEPDLAFATKLTPPSYKQGSTAMQVALYFNADVTLACLL